MDQLFQKENNINISNRQSTLDTNKNSVLLYNNGKFFSFSKDNSLNNKLTPNTSSFIIKVNMRTSIDNTTFNNNTNTFLNKKRKLMTSEELELEQIERERKEVKKMIKKNMELYYRTKSGTTTIVSKIRDNIYNTNNNNVNKNEILNNYIKSNNNNNNYNYNNFNKNININNTNFFNNNNNGIGNTKLYKSNSYTMNFLKEKGINKINVINKTINTDNNIDNNNNFYNNTDSNNNNININYTSTNKTPHKEQIIEIINTDIDVKNNKTSVDREKDDKEEENNNIILNEKKEEENVDENDNNITKDIQVEVENIVKKEKETKVSPFKKTPNKESSYLTKMKKLGSMSKLSLCNKIQKYTEICQEVLKEQENGEDIKEEKVKKGKEKKQKGKKKNKKSCSKK